jgi:hypothetical protein
VAPAPDGAASSRPLLLVQEGNPILSSELCMSKKKLIVQLGNDRKSKAARAAYDALHTDYVDNLRKVEALLGRLTQKGPTGTHTLRNISNDDLDLLTKDIKNAVVQFYLRPIVQYQMLLDMAKTMHSVRVDV